MASLTNFQLFSFVIWLTIVSGGIRTKASSPAAVKAAYWPSDSDLPPSRFDTSLFTHIYYAFLKPSNITYKLEVSYSEALRLYNFTTTLHYKNPPVKTLFSIGGGSSDMYFSGLVSKASSRKVFIDSALEVARKFGFDGMDMDWEYPQSPEKMQDLSHLLYEWRRVINEEARATNRPPLLLTAAAYFSPDFFLDKTYRIYPIDSINQNLDWVNAMCYDYHGSWNTSLTGAHAALFDPKSNISTSYGLRSWIRAGLRRENLVMGLPLYGRTWRLKDPNSHGIGSPAIGVSLGEDGVLSFTQVETFNKNNNATVVFDTQTVSTYCYAGTVWIGYDDPTSATLKLEFAQALRLRGYFFWALGDDREWKIPAQASRVWITDE